MVPTAAVDRKDSCADLAAICSLRSVTPRSGCRVPGRADGGVFYRATASVGGCSSGYRSKHFLIFSTESAATARRASTSSKPKPKQGPSCPMDGHHQALCRNAHRRGIDLKKAGLWYAATIATTSLSAIVDVVLLLFPPAEAPAVAIETGIIEGEATEADAAQLDATVVGGRSPSTSCLNGNSFVPATGVLMADGSTKKIKDVKIGDAVLATDPETGKTAPEEVTALHDNLDHDFADLQIKDTAGRTSTIHTTANHPFWDDTAHQWTPAAKLPAHHAVRGLDGSVAHVVGVLTLMGNRHMLNLTVNELHTYYVLAGTTPVLVHNDNGSDLPDRETARLDVMRRAGIPLDANPIDELRNASGVQYVYDVDGRYMLVTENTMGRSHPGEPHWEAGPAKPGLQVDNYGRYRVSNDKVKANFSYGAC